MNVECPICHMQGTLEIRGNSQRVSHYKGFIDGKRIYEKHTVLGINGNKSLGIKNLRIGSNSRTVAGGEGFEPSTPNLGGWCSIRHEYDSPSTSPFASAGYKNSRIRPELPARSDKATA